MTTTALKLNEEPHFIGTFETFKEMEGAIAEAELEVLAEKALVASQKLAAAELASKSASDAFKKALEKAGKLTEDTKAVGPVRTVIYPTRRFDETTARGLMSKKLQKECEKTVLDTKLVQAKVSPETYQSFQKVSGYTMKLSIAD